MARAKGAYIGGFLGSKRQAQRVGSEVRRYYDLAEGVYTETFAESMLDIARTASAIHKRRTITNSAGVLAAREALALGAKPDELILVVGCMPTTVSKLAVQSTLKTLSMPKREGWKRTTRFNRECLQEIGMHLPSNLKHLYAGGEGSIPNTNTLAVAVEAAQQDIPVTVAFAQHDEFEYGKDVPDWVSHAKAFGVTVAYVPAYHDGQLHDPTGFHDAVQDSRNHVY